MFTNDVIALRRGETSCDNRSKASMRADVRRVQQTRKKRDPDKGGQISSHRQVRPCGSLCPNWLMVVQWAIFPRRPL